MAVVITGSTITAPAGAIDAADLTGDLDASLLTGTLPAIDGSALTGIDAGGTTLVATITTSGAREVSASSLDLSSYSQLFFFGYNVQGNNYYDYVHIRDSGDSTSGYNRIGQIMRNETTDHRGYFGGVIDLNTGMGFCSCMIVNVSNGTQRDTGSIVAAGLDTGITTSTTSVVIGHTEGNSGNFQGGTVKLYGA